MPVTTGVISGNVVGVYRANVLIGCSTGATFNGTNSEIETSCKDNDGAITYEPGAQGWSITINGNAKVDNVEGMAELMALWKTKGTSTFKYGTSNAADPYLEGQGYISAFTWEGPLNAPSTWSATVSPRGPIYLFNT